MNRSALISATVVLASLVASGPSTKAGPMYGLTPIGGLPGSTRTTVSGLNNRGQVVGVSKFDESYPTFPFIYSDGRTSPIGSSSGTVAAINNAGDVIGHSEDREIGPYLYNDGNLKSLRSYEGERLFVSDINDAGNYSGLTTQGHRKANGHPDTLFMPYRQEGGQRLGTYGTWFGDTSFLNNNNHFVVRIFDSYGSDFNIFNDGDREKSLVSDTTAYRSVRVAGLNDSDELVGSARFLPRPAGFNDGGPVHAFSWKDGEFRDLGTLGGPSSNAFGINANGAIVGKSDVEGDSTTHAFLERDGQMVDLNTLISPELNWLLVEATQINDLGQIIGNGINARGEPESFLLTPEADSSVSPPSTTAPVPVPEPTTLAIFGLAGLAAWLRRARRP